MIAEVIVFIYLLTYLPVGSSRLDQRKLRQGALQVKMCQDSTLSNLLIIYRNTAGNEGCTSTSLPSVPLPLSLAIRLP